MFLIFLFLLFFKFLLESSPIHEAILKRQCFITKLGERCPVSILSLGHASPLHSSPRGGEPAGGPAGGPAALRVEEARGGGAAAAHCALEAAVVVDAAPPAEAAVKSEFGTASAEAEVEAA